MILNQVATLTRLHMQPAARTSSGFGGTGREHVRIFQGNKGYFEINLRKQGTSQLLKATSTISFREQWKTLTREQRKSETFKGSRENANPNPCALERSLPLSYT